MVQILPQIEERPSFLDSLLAGMGQATPGAVQQYFSNLSNKKRDQAANSAIQRLTGQDLSGLDPESRRAITVELLKQGGATKKQNQEMERNLQSLRALEKERDLPEGSLDAYSSNPSLAERATRPQKKTQASQPIDPEQLEIISQMRSLPGYRDLDESGVYEALTSAGVSKENAEAEAKLRSQQLSRSGERAKEERGSQEFYTRKADEQVEGIRSSMDKREMALDLARNAVESGNLSFFSPDKLADRTGLEVFRTAKGAQLLAAGKENLLSNMARTSARAQNIWFEQRLNSLFPQIGQSQEANLTVAEMLEGEDLMDRAYLKEYDRLREQDKEDYGYVKGDTIRKRTADSVKERNKEIFNRTNYRIRELEEQEMGITRLKSQVGKNVPKGAPLTLAMAKLYKEKFGDKALEVAKKNGYYIPSIEEFDLYQQPPHEARERISQ